MFAQKKKREYFTTVHTHSSRNCIFAKPHFSETPQENYDNLSLFCIPKVLKGVAKIMKIGSGRTVNRVHRALLSFGILI